MKKTLKQPIKTDCIEKIVSVSNKGSYRSLVWFVMLFLLVISHHTVFAQVVSMNGSLSVNGNKIVNKNGVPVSFAGNSFFWSNTGWGGQKYYNANVVAWLKNDWNAAIVRVAMGVEDGGGYLDNPNGNFSNKIGNKARAKAVIDAAIANNMYVIIDWHTHHAEWNTSEAIAFFQEMAQTYGHLPNVMYEVYNEPLGVSWSNVIKPYAIQVIDAIRAIDPDNIIIVGTPTWSADVDQAANDPINRSNIAYTVHFYAGSHGQANRNKCQYALDKGLAVVITEWGTVNADGGGAVNVAETNAWIELIKRNQLTTCNWSINDKAEGASAVTPGASTTGGWPDNNLTWSGSVVRTFMRSYDYGSLKDEINFVNSPNLTTSKNTYTVNVDYSVAQKRDLVVSFCASDNSVLQSKTIQIEGATSVDVMMTLNSMPVVGEQYSWKIEVRPLGGNATTNLASQINSTVLILAQPPLLVIEAEAYDAMSGIKKEACKESGDNVSYIDDNDWLSYANVTIPVAGRYKIYFRVASMGSAGVISLEKDAGVTKLGTFSVPNTGGWQNWTTISKTIDLPQGNYSLGLGIPTGGFNINWFAIASDGCIANITAPNETFCPGGNAVLTASIGTSYKWLNGNSQVGSLQTYTASTAGSYTVEVTNAAGCKAVSDAKVITVSAIPAAIITTPNTSFCPGGNAVLTASTGSSYKWMNGTTQVGALQTYTASTAGSYTVEVTNAAGCKAISDAKVITISAIPAAIITTPNTSFCPGGNALLTASTGTSYKWMNGTTQVGALQTYTASTAGSYTVEVSNAAGCKAISDAKIITVSAIPTATITAPSTSFCPGGNAVLTASIGTSYKWMNGNLQVGSLQTYTPSTAGSYTVEVTNAAGCKAISDAKVITVSAIPTATITTPNTSFCQGGNALLTASTGTSYKWMNGTTQVGALQTYTASTAGSYTVEVTNAAGCKAISDAKVITISALPTAAITSPSTSFCLGGNVVLTASTGTSYKWMNGTTQVGALQTYTASTAGSYTVEVTNASGCKALSDAIMLTETTSMLWYADVDNDGKGDANTTISSCVQPVGYVSTSGDACPLDANKIAAGNCGCGNTEQSCMDCAGIANGTASLDVCNICSGGTTGRTPITDIDKCHIATGIDVVSPSAKINVSPNPFMDQLVLKIPAGSSVDMMDMNGRLVFQGINVETIETGYLSTGLYIVRITNASGVQFVKVEKVTN